MKMRITSALLVVAIIIGLFPLTAVVKASATDNGLMLWYKFNEGNGTTAADSSGNNRNGTLNGSCSWTQAPNGSGAISLDGSTGYVKIPDGILSGVKDITVTTNVYVDNSSTDPFWMFTFGSSTDPTSAAGTKYFGLLEDGSGNLRNTISTNRWSSEQNTAKGSGLSKGVWKHLAFTLSGTTGILYEDGRQIAQNTNINVEPQDIESTIANYIGKPAYPGDKYFKGKISDFRIYNRALSDNEIKNAWIESLTDADAVTAVKGLLDLGDISAVKTSINLPAAYSNTSISWSSNNTSVIGNDGTVTRPSNSDTVVNLTATITRGSAVEQKIFAATVLKSGTVYSLDSTAYNLYINKTHDTVLTAIYDDLSTANVTSNANFTSSDTSVATVNASGVVTGIKPGKATITATYNAQIYAAEVTVVNDMVVWYKLDESSGTIAADSSGNGRNGTLSGGASWTQGINGSCLQLDGKNGYLAMPNNILQGVNDITISSYMKLDASATAPQWLATFSNTANGYIYFSPTLGGQFRYSITKTNWSGESLVGGTPIGTNVWKHVAVTFSSSTGMATLYVDGTAVASSTVTIKPSDLEPTNANFIGRPWPGYGDQYFKGNVSDFRVYNRVLDSAEIKNLSSSASSESVAQDKAALDLGDLSQVTNDITLPTVGTSGSTIAWSSSDENLVSSTGVVTRPQFNVGNKQATLTATITKGNITDTKSFTLTVIALPEGQDQAIATAMPQLVIPNANDVRGNITLPNTITVGKETVNIDWSTDRTDVISVNSKTNANYDPTPAGVVTRQDTDTNVKLTATLTHGTVAATKDITITVKAKPVTINESDYKGYLFAYFNGTDRTDAEQIYFASSKNGLRWNNLNNNNPVLTSNVGDKGVRDPYIFRSAEGDKFYMVATDLRIANGAGWWAAQSAGSKSVVVWESTDLVNWSPPRLVKVSNDDAGCTWAPEVQYDDKTGEYIMFWASRVSEDNYAKQRIYIAKTRDFYTFTTPQVWIERTNDVIDSDVIKYNGTYYRFSKDETNKNVSIDTSDQLLNKDFTPLPSTTVEGQIGVEGPECFKFNGQNKWCLLLDNYGAGGYYPLISNDLTSGIFNKLDSSQYTMPTGPRHGAVINITQAEYDAIMAKWGSNVPQYTGVDSLSFDKNQLSIERGRTVSLTPIVTPASASYKDVEWSSSDPTVATVNNGVVTALKEGTTKISVTSLDNPLAVATCDLTVTPLKVDVPVKSISINYPSINMNLNDSLKLVANVVPSNVTLNAVTWSSSDEKVVKVAADGTLIPVGYGTATIKAVSVQDLASTGICTVNVVKGYNLLYYVNAGDGDSTGFDQGEEIPQLNSREDQAYGQDSITGKSWGYVLSDAGTTWSQDQEHSSGNDKYNCLRQYNGNAEGKGITYKFQVPNGSYNIDMGFYDPWNSSGRLEDIVINGDTKLTGFIMGSTKVKKSFYNIKVTDGTLSIAVLNSKGSTDNPFLSWISVGSYVPADSVNINNSSLSLKVGDTSSLSAIQSPWQTDAEGKITWTSSNEKVATVDAIGKVTAVAPGAADIKATSTDGNKTATCEVTVLSSDATLSSIAVNGTALTEFTSNKQDYTLTLPASTTQIPQVTATSSDKAANVAITQASSLDGIAKIVVTAADGVTMKTYTVKFVKQNIILPTKLTDKIDDIVNAINNLVGSASINLDANDYGIAGKVIFDAIKGADKTVVFSTNNAEWTFNGKDITSDTKAIDLNVKTQSLSDFNGTTKAGIQAKVNSQDVFVISFAENGILPGKATVRIKLDENWLKNKDKNNLNIYYYNPTTKETEVIAKQLKVDNYGYVQFQITHNSDYFVADKDITETTTVTTTNTTETTNTTNATTTTTNSTKTTTNTINTAVLPKTGNMLDFNALFSSGILLLIVGISTITFRRRKITK